MFLVTMAPADNENNHKKNIGLSHSTELAYNTGQGIFRSGTDLISLLVLSSCCCSSSSRGHLFKKAQDSVISNRIEVKFGENILHVNTHRLIESHFRIDVTFDATHSRWRPWCHFTQQSAATWWVNTKRLTGSSSSVSSWSIVHFVFVIVPKLITFFQLSFWSSGTLADQGTDPVGVAKRPIWLPARNQLHFRRGAKNINFSVGAAAYINMHNAYRTMIPVKMVLVRLGQRANWGLQASVAILACVTGPNTPWCFLVVFIISRNATQSPVDVVRYRVASLAYPGRRRRDCDGRRSPARRRFPVERTHHRAPTTNWCQSQRHIRRPQYASRVGVSEQILRSIIYLSRVLGRLDHWS